jgi:hypothetical protein
MKTLTTSIAALMVATSAFTANAENTVCDIDLDTVIEYPGYAGKQNVFYDRGDYFFMFVNERFLNPISYKHYNKVEAITNHIRVYKDDCRMTDIEIVHTESKDPEPIPEPIVAELPVAPVGPTSYLDLPYSLAADMANVRELINSPSFGANGETLSSLHHEAIQSYSDLWNTAVRTDIAIPPYLASSVNIGYHRDRRHQSIRDYTNSDYHESLYVASDRTVAVSIVHLTSP